MGIRLTLPSLTPLWLNICSAVLFAMCLYWKRVLCLQQAACTTRLLRAYGIRSHLKIGYRPVPFLSHAWVEIDGRVVTDPAAYAKRMQILHTM